MNPYVGEIRMFAGNFPPAGWAFCNGQMLPIAEFETLFVLIGTTYGGDGQETFQLPDFSGRLPVHASSDYVLGQTGGVEQVTLTAQQLPVHSHDVLATSQRATPGDSVSGAGALASTAGSPVYGLAGANTADMAPEAIGISAGGSQPHNNMAPYLCISFIISLQGNFPSQT